MKIAPESPAISKARRKLEEDMQRREQKLALKCMERAAQANRRQWERDSRDRQPLPRKVYEPVTEPGPQIRKLAETLIQRLPG